jgi:hypothetical protein
MFRALLEAGKELRASVRSPTVFELRDNLSVTDEELLDFVRAQDQHLKDALLAEEKLHRFSIIAVNIAMSYLIGIGTSVRELFAIGWLCVAAGAGDGHSVHLFGPLEQSVDNHPEGPLPRRVWSVFGTFSGYRHNAECIRATDPGLAKIATRMYRRRLWGRAQAQIVRIEPYLPDLIDRIRDNLSLVDAEVPSRRGYTNINETALHICAATGDLESARYLDSALQRSIYSDARDLFFLLLNEFPSLLDEVGDHGRRPLHSAATQEWPGYVQELLHRGASPYHRSRDRSTPFSWAVMRNHNIEVAQLLADSCDDMSPILGPDEQSGFTCFGKVLSGMIAYRMDYGVERLRYLVEKFGTPDFFCCINPNGGSQQVGLG